MHLIDLDRSSRMALVQDCEEAGWNIQTFDSISGYLSAGGPEAETCLLILSLPAGWHEMNLTPDISAFEHMLKQHPQTQLVLLLPEGCPAGDHLALTLNARNTLFKPYDIEDLSKILVMIASGTGKRKRMKALQNRMAAPHGFEEIIGVSDKIKAVIELAQRIAESDDTSVMIVGECGTGKGALAQAVHHASSRSTGPFIEVNCAAIPRNLLESEFFGHEKGAFTDAKEEKIGLFADLQTSYPPGHIDGIGGIEGGCHQRLRHAQLHIHDP